MIDAWNGPHPDVQDLTSGLPRGSVFVAPDLWDSQTSPPDQFPSAHVATIPICLWCWIVTHMSVGCGVPGVKCEGPSALTVPVQQVDVRLSSWFSQGPLSEMGPLYAAGVNLQSLLLDPVPSLGSSAL